MKHEIVHQMLITMAAAISAGVVLIALSRWLEVSAIVLLLLGGFALGPEGLDIVRPLTLGNGLPVIVSLAIGLILFEGGLTLDLRGYRQASGPIRRLLSVGVLVTWLSTALLVWLVFAFDPAFCLLAASLVIVTGPTVIAPLLKRVKVHRNLHSILHWEGVLVDPIGVFVAILCFEWMGAQSRELVLARFLLRFVVGIGLGIAGGLTIYRLIRSRFVPDDMMNVFALACAVLVFGVAESLFSEAGLLAVTVAGFVLGLKRPGELQQIRQFKAEITDLLIGTLFILLVARLELAQFIAFGWQGALLVALIIAVVRPLNVLFSSWGSGLSWREKAFLSWVAPRGIVAASMASLFTLSLQQRQGFSQAAFLETFTYSVIVATVLLQGFTAGGVARLLSVRRQTPRGWLIVGAHHLGRRLARFLSREAGLPVLLVDTNPRAVAAARAEGLPALRDDARGLDYEEVDELQEIGYLLALTDNEDLNMLLCQRWAGFLDKNHVFFWSTGRGDTRRIAGLPIWSHLPKPSLVSGELERGEAVLVGLEDPHEDLGDLATPLLALRQKRVLVPQQADFDEDVEAAIFLCRRADYLARCLRPELALRLTVTDRRELFARLVDRVTRLVPALPSAEILAELSAREEAFPTALGHGVAVPHAYCPALAQRLCAVAQVPDGVDFAAPDGEPVRLVFLLLSPPNDPEGHLETLAEIARLVSLEEVRRSLLAAEPGDLLDLLRRPSA